MASIYDVIADPNRRAILALLAGGERSVGEIESALSLPQPYVSKHLNVLRTAGLVESRADAQRRLYRLKPEPLQQIDAWLAPFRRIWSSHVDALERHLDGADDSALPTQKSAGQRRRRSKTGKKTEESRR